MAPTSDKAAASLFSANVAGTLRMLAYLALATVTMVADRHLALLPHARQLSAVLVEPVFAVAALPGRFSRSLAEATRERSALQQENRHLREELLLAEARITRMRGLAEQNRRYRELLAVREQLGLQVQTARLLDVDLGLYRHRMLLDAGRLHDVRVGMTVMDAQGVMGQVVEVGQRTAQVILITDPEHAIPVVDERTDLRVVLRGTGRRDRLQIQAIPASADVRVGDRLTTSGLGGRFPAGFPVARIVAVGMDEDGLFQYADAVPVANLGTSSEVLLLRDQPEFAGPPALAPAFGPPRALAAPEATSSP